MPLNIQQKNRSSKFEEYHSIVFDGLINAEFNIFPSQREALIKIKDYFDIEGRDIALLVQPPSTGKSCLISLIPYVLKSHRVLIITPSVKIANHLYDIMCGINTNAKTFYEERAIIDSNDKAEFVENAHVIVNRITNKSFSNIAKITNLVIVNTKKFGDASKNVDMHVDICKIPKDLFDTIIVDEAHRYPANTWNKLIDHFSDPLKKIQKIFLTTTPFKRSSNDDNVPILGDKQQQLIAYELKESEAIGQGIIRRICFEECGNDVNVSEKEVYSSVIKKIAASLKEHDIQNNKYAHQAMILVSSKEKADEIEQVYNIYPSKIGEARAYYGQNSLKKLSVFDDFRQGRNNIRVLIVCDKTFEDFDRKEVSVLGILRNVSINTFLFTEFIGRCLGRHKDDCEDFKACIVSHKVFNQRANFDSLNFIAEEDPQEETLDEMDLADKLNINDLTETIQNKSPLIKEEFSTFHKSISNQKYMKNMSNEAINVIIHAYLNDYFTKEANLFENVTINTTKIDKFVQEAIKYIQSSTVTEKISQHIFFQMLGFVALMLKSHFSIYYIDDSNSDPQVFEKFIQEQPKSLSFNEEMREYSFSLFNEPKVIDKIQKEYTQFPIWAELLKDSLLCFQDIYKSITHNYIVTFGSIPGRKIDCCLVVITEYLSEWFTSIRPFSINFIPIVFIYDRVSFCTGTKTIHFHNPLSIGISVSGDQSNGSGTLTCFLQEVNSNKIYALIPAHVGFKNKTEMNISKELLQPGQSETQDERLDEFEENLRPIGSLDRYTFRDVIDGFSLDAALYQMNSNRLLGTPKNCFFENFRNKNRETFTHLTGIANMDYRDDETPYYIYGKQTANWSRCFLNEYPFKAIIDGAALSGEMFLSKIKGVYSSALCLPGDSGAVVINEKAELVGMLYGGSYMTDCALITPFSVILKAFPGFKLAI